MQRFVVVAGNARIPLDFGGGATITNNGPGTLSYVDKETQTSVSTVASGSSVSLAGTQWLFASSNCTVTFLEPTGGSLSDLTTRVQVEETSSSPAASTYVGREKFDVTRYGMSAGVNEPVSKLKAAVDAAALVKGDVVLPPLTAGGHWKISGSLQLTQGVGLLGYQGQSNVSDKGSVLECTASAPAIIMPNDATALQVAEIRVQDLAIASAGNCISVPNGGIDVLLRRLYLTPGTAGKAVHHKGFVQDWHVDDVRIEGWHGTIASSAHYGWYSDAELGSGGAGCRMDDCNFDYFYASGTARGNFYFRIPISDNVVFKMLRSVTCARHGLVLAGGLGSWLFMSPNFEGNGYLGAGLSVTPTTGTIAAGSAVLTVASGTGIANGNTITVRRALDGVNDLVTTVSSGGGTTTLTLAATAGYAVTATDVTTALYSDVYVGPDTGSPEGLGTTIGGGPQNTTFIAPAWGIWPLRTDHMLRYAANLSGVTACHVINPKQNARPVYDPSYVVTAADDPQALEAFTPTRNWQTPIMAANWTASSDFQVRRVARRVFTKGTATAAAGAGASVCTLPPGCRPNRLVTTGNIFGGVTQITSAGAVSSSQLTVGTIALPEGMSNFSVD